MLPIDSRFSKNRKNNDTSTPTTCVLSTILSRLSERMQVKPSAWHRISSPQMVAVIV